MLCPQIKGTVQRDGSGLKVVSFLSAQLVIRFLIANYCPRWGCNFKELSHDGGRAKFAENLGASTFNKDLSNDPTPSAKKFSNAGCPPCVLLLIKKTLLMKMRVKVSSGPFCIYFKTLQSMVSVGVLRPQECSIKAGIK